MLDTTFWGEQGRVGVAHAGTYADRYVFAYPDTIPGWWAVFVEARDVDPAPIDIYFQGDEDLHSLISEWGVEWLPQESDSHIEAQHFGMRPLVA